MHRWYGPAPRPHRWTYATTAEAFESCAGIEAGPAFAVEAPGDVTFTAGTRVVLRDGFSVDSGASFVAGTDPTLAGGTEIKTFQYQDVQYFLTGAELPWTSLTWTYDRIGNRLTETRDGTTDTYAYVVNGSSGNTALLDQVTLGVGGTRDYTFGAAGHLEEVAAGANVVDFASDGEGRLSEVARTGGRSSPFVYDGRSFLSQAGDLATVGTTRPAYSSDGRVMALRRQATVADPELTDTILYFAGRPVAQLETGGPEIVWWYLTTDHLGTPQVATDETGAETWSSRLEPFGQDLLRGTPDGALENGVFLRLPGQWETETWQDAALGAGVYYNVHRWYELGTSRYSRPDPAFRPLIGQQYLYSKSNPLFYYDPLGLHETSFPHGGPYHYMRPPGSDFKCVAEIRDQVRREADGQTRYQHCLANCLISKRCPGGKTVAVMASLIKEMGDLGRCILERKGGNCDSAFQPDDFNDNETGRDCPPEIPCHVQCEDLRNRDEPPPGPFGGLNPDR